MDTKSSSLTSRKAASRNLAKKIRHKKPTGKSKFNPINSHNQRLEEELQRLQHMTNFGHEIVLEWLPGVAKFNNGKQLVEEVIENTIFIYDRNPQKALELVRHGFAEWILNQHTRPYRQLINKLITLFEEQHYERKEKLIESLVNIFL